MHLTLNGKRPAIANRGSFGAGGIVPPIGFTKKRARRDATETPFQLGQSSELRCLKPPMDDPTSALRRRDCWAFPSTICTSQNGARVR